MRKYFRESVPEKNPLFSYQDEREEHLHECFLTKETRMKKEFNEIDTSCIQCDFLFFNNILMFAIISPFELFFVISSIYFAVSDLS